tara:strand:+ start:139 stop:597 length:459 start_codon:yes stop_codon:yes gene_type:complete
MFLIVHSTAGIALGSLTGNPIIAFAMGLISHLVLDIIPHGDEELGKWAIKGGFIKRMSILFIIDFSIALLFIFIFFRNNIIENPYPLLAGAIGGILPDLLVGFVTIFKSKTWNWYLIFHKINHELLQRPIPWKYGMGIQILTLFLLTYQILS